MAITLYTLAFAFLLLALNGQLGRFLNDETLRQQAREVYPRSRARQDAHFAHQSYLRAGRIASSYFFAILAVVCFAVAYFGSECPAI